MKKVEITENYIHKNISLCLCNKTKEIRLFKKQCNFLKSILPLIGSIDNESILLSIFYLKEEGWNRHITVNPDQFGYSIQELITGIELGLIEYSVILEKLLETIITNKIYYVHSYSPN